MHSTLISIILKVTFKASAWLCSQCSSRWKTHPHSLRFFWCSEDNLLPFNLYVSACGQYVHGWRVRVWVVVPLAKHVRFSSLHCFALHPKCWLQSNYLTPQELCINQCQIHNLWVIALQNVLTGIWNAWMQIGWRWLLRNPTANDLKRYASNVLTCRKIFYEMSEWCLVEA